MATADIGALPPGTRGIAVALLASGSLHLVRPDVFAPLVPPELGPARPWVFGSGVAELVCGAGLLGRQRWAPAASTALLGAVWVGNIHMARRFSAEGRPGWQQAAAWARVPLQVPMMRATWGARRTRPTEPG